MNGSNFLPACSSGCPMPKCKPPKTGIKILFLGFANSGVDLRKYYHEKYEIWTMNDYYKWFPDLRPHMIFEIHREGSIEESQKSGRFPGDYRTIYNASGADVVTRYPHDLDNEQNVDTDFLIYLFGERFFVGTFSFMFAWAILRSFKRALGDPVQITIEGIHLNRHSEYHTQIPGMLRNIYEARLHGIEVIVTGGYERTWRALGPNIKEEWKGIYG